MTEFNFRGGTYFLHFNGLALFDTYKKFGNDIAIGDLIDGSDAEHYRNLIWMLCETAQQGELYRRMLGYDNGQVLQFQQTLSAVTPAEILDIKLAVMEAVNEGFRRETKDEGDDDPYLLEFERENSKKKQSARASMRGRLQRVWACLTRRA